MLDAREVHRFLPGPPKWCKLPTHTCKSLSRPDARRTNDHAPGWWGTSLQDEERPP